MTQNNIFRPLLILVPAFMAGISLVNLFPGLGRWAVSLIFVSSFFILYFIKKQKSCLFPPLLLFFALGCLSLQQWTAPDFPENHVTKYADIGKHSIIGTINSPPYNDNFRTKFIIKARNIGNKPASGLIQVTIPFNDAKKYPGLSSGDKISFTGKIKPVRNFNNPGGFDYEKHMIFQGIWCTSYAHKNSFKILEHNSKTRVSQAIENSRKVISDFINRASDKQAQAILNALIIGNRNEISHELRQDFNKAGISHLLAISGLHIGIITFISFFLFQKILSRIDFFLWNALSRKGAAILTLIPVLAYAVISGMSPATQRAIIMAVICMAALCASKEINILNILAVAAMTILIINPPTLFSISFQLSFAAVLTISYGFTRIYNLEIPANRTSSFFIRKFISSIIVSLLAIPGTLPLTMLYFNQLSATGFVSNLVFIPAIGFMVVPLGLISVFLLPFCQDLSFSLMDINARLLSQILVLVSWFADHIPGYTRTITPTIFEICIFYTFLWAIITLVPYSKQGSEPGNKVIFKSLAKILLLCSLIAGIIDSGYWFYQRYAHKNLEVSVIDVGQGNSILVDMPGGDCILIDGGGFYANSVFDVGARIVAPFLWNKKIKTIDTLILSHPDGDHMNGLLYIAENFNVKTLITNGETKDSETWNKFMEIIRKNNINMPDFIELPRSWESGKVKFQILYPPYDLQGKEKWKHESNNRSLVIKLIFGDISILFPGDIEYKAEHKLVEINKELLKSTILIAPHHGCKTSSSDLLLEYVSPEIIIVSVGWKNRFNCPHPSVLTRYHNNGVKIFRTDFNGAVTLSSDSKNFEITPQKLSY